MAKKYQLGGDTLKDAIKQGIVVVPDEYKDMFPDLFPQSPTPSFAPIPGTVSRNNVSSRGNVQGLLENGYKITPNEQGALLSKETGNIQPNRYFEAFNTLAQTTTGIANKLSDIQQDKKYYSDLRNAFQPRNWENTQEQGLNNLPVYYQKGGPVNRTIEAEKGEVYTDIAGGISKIPDSASSHEQGGERISDAERVLENTSTRRSDEDSKMLKLSPDIAEALTGHRPSQSVSHSKALERATEETDKKVKKFEIKLKKNVESLQANPKDKYATNSMNLNLASLDKIPTSGEIFDILFDHQEGVKHIANMTAQTKYAIGGPVDPIDPYLKSKTQSGRTTPTGKSSLYNRGQDYLQAWEEIIPGISALDNKEAQSKIYDYMLQSDEGKGILSQMWREYGLTNQGKKYKDLTSMTNNGRFSQDKELGDEQLSNLKKAYVDGMFGARQVLPPAPTPQTPTPRIPIDPIPVPTPETPTPETPFNVPVTNRTITTNPKSRFNEPLRWYDVASPIQSLLSSDRLPINYDAPQFNQIKLALQNPAPALQNAQTDYNTALQTFDPTTGFGASNTANLFSKKYAADNQVLGQYENIKNQIRNQEIQYNANVRDRQSASDVQARQVFEDKYLGSREAQRQQTLTAWDDLFTRVAQNRRLNRDGALTMQLFPAFDQNLNFNGYQVPIRNPLNVPNNQGNVQYITDPKTGSKYRVIIGADGKPISQSKVIGDDKAVGAKNNRK